MKFIEKIMNFFGYEKITKEKDTLYTIDKEPYCKNGIWYGVYDYITDENLSEQELKVIKEKEEIYFRLAPAEWLRLNTFIKNHTHEDNQEYLDGPKIWIGFGSGGGIGKCVYVKCEICGKTHDITDISCW